MCVNKNTGEKKLFHKVSEIDKDFERISDHAENIVEYLDLIKSRKATISEQGLSELRLLADATLKSIKESMIIFATEDYDRIPEAEELEQTVDRIQTEIVNSHIERLMKDSCNPAGGVIFADMSTDLERSSDHAINVACALAEI